MMFVNKLLSVGMMSILLLGSCSVIDDSEGVSVASSEEFLTISLIEQDPTILFVNEKSESKMFAAFKEAELSVGENNKKQFEKDWASSYDKHDTLMSKIIHAYNFTKGSRAQ